MTRSSDLEAARDRLRPCVEKARGFSGWTAFPLARKLTPGPPWDYIERARRLMQNAASVIDLGTGGGERFGEICAGFHGRVVATEEWDVNAPIAAANLRLLGASVLRCQSLHLPLSDLSFDLVLDRHEELDPAEVARILRPGGTVLTQQVGSDSWPELRAFFPRKTLWPDHYNLYRRGFEASGLQVVDARFHETRVAYESLGDLVHLLSIVPWEIPGFDPLGADLEALLDLESQLTTPEGLVLTEHRYILEAHKAA